MKSYLTLSDTTAEIVVQRSRFIAYLYHIEGEEDAREKLTALRKKHYDATHVCYAYIADESGNISKFSDDGEPSSTAGAPILAVISGYRKILAAVVRYFGGTKLGVGGLVKAYTDAAAAALANAEVKEYAESNMYALETGYAEYEKCRKALEACKIAGLDYSDTVKCEFFAKAEYDIVKELTETLGGQPSIQLLKESVYTDYKE